MARRRGAACLAIVGLLGVADAARAGLATATVHVETLGRSLAGAVAELQATNDPTLRWSRLIGDIQNRTTFNLVPPGTYRVTVSLAGFSGATLDVRVEPGTLMTLRADLQPAG